MAQMEKEALTECKRQEGDFKKRERERKGKENSHCLVLYSVLGKVFLQHLYVFLPTL